MMAGVNRMLRIRDVYLIRFAIGTMYSIIGALLVAAYMDLGLQRGLGRHRRPVLQDVGCVHPLHGRQLAGL